MGDTAGLVLTYIVLTILGAGSLVGIPTIFKVMVAGNSLSNPAVVVVAIIEGEEPWSTSLLQALRTWRFRAPPIDASLSFQVQAEFVRASSISLPSNGNTWSQFTGSPGPATIGTR